LPRSFLTVTATGTGVCVAIYHWVPEANDEMGGCASFPSVKPPPPPEMMV